MSNRIDLRAHVRVQLPQIKARIRAVELQIAPPEAKKLAVEFNESPVFPLGAPYGVPAERQREEYFQGTPIDDLIAHLEKLKLPADRAFVDCGSGLGSACFAAAAVFDRVTGFESNPEIWRHAESIRQELGISNVTFHRWDFIDVSLTPFNVVFFYKPFVRDFAETMREKLLETEPGTVIISNKYLEGVLIDHANFQFRGPLAGWHPTTENPFMPIADFYTFVRK